MRHEGGMGTKMRTKEASGKPVTGIQVAGDAM